MSDPSYIGSRPLEEVLSAAESRYLEGGVPSVETPAAGGSQELPHGITTKNTSRKRPRRYPTNSDAIPYAAPLLY